jgi:hypothetical protein
MAIKATEGTCRLCGRTFGKRAMVRHLAACAGRTAEAAGTSKSKKRPPLLLLAEGYPPAVYWMYLAADAKATLTDLDDFLRDIWLECCGHMSEFEIAGERYSPCEPGDGYEAESTDVRLTDVLLGVKHFTHEYDFGSTTQLRIKVLQTQLPPLPPDADAPTPVDEIRLLARNAAPAFECCVCGAAATRIRVNSYEPDSTYYCDACAEKLEADEDEGEVYFLPLVNSPRTGVCGYTGNAEE